MEEAEEDARSEAVEGPEFAYILLLLMWIWAANRGFITKSTIQREKLEQSACQEIDTWFSRC